MPYTVVRTPLAWIPMRDGIKLAARLWMPELDDNSTDRLEEEEKFPVILGEIFINSVFKKLSHHSGFRRLEPC